MDDHWIEDHAEEVLAGHEPSCTATAVEDAYAHGVDDPQAGSWMAAAQFLENGDSPCMCVRYK